MIVLKQCQSGFPNICSDKDFKERYEMEKLSSIHQHGGWFSDKHLRLRWIYNGFFFTQKFYC